MEIEFYRSPGNQRRLGELLLEQLGNTDWTALRAAVAFVKSSGVRHISNALRDFSARANAEFIVGVDLGGTSEAGLSSLFHAIGETGAIYVFHNTNGSTFHPKVYVFANDVAAFVVIGSGNLTAGGLFTNYESSLAVSLDLTVAKERSVLDRIEDQLEVWKKDNSGTCRMLDDKFLNELIDAGYLPPEVYSSEDGGFYDPDATAAQLELFGFVEVPAAPTSAQAPAGTERARSPQVFLMTLQQTDVGRGQVNPGTQARSPEIFIPLAARDAAPEFWEWTSGFVEDTEKPGKWDRRDVNMLIGLSEIAQINMMTWPDKHDFRLRSEVLRGAGSVGDIIRIEKTPDAIGYEYIVQIIRSGTSQFPATLGQCTNPVRNSTRRWGYL